MIVNKSKFENLEAWKAAHKLTIMIYKTTKNFPADEKFRLIDQICRSSSSVAANLAEGGNKVSSFTFKGSGLLERF